MSDTSIVWDVASGQGDWVLVGAQLQTGDDLVTAILISLFTDRGAATDDVIPDSTADPRGWWADDTAHPIGSRLWLLARSKQTTATLSLALKYVSEALQWLIDDSVVARFDITVEWTRASLLGCQIVAHKNDGSTISTGFQSVWKGIA